MASGIVSMNDRYKTQRMERFAAWKRGTNLNKENRTRYALISAVMHQFRTALLEDSRLSSEETLNRLGTALEEFKNASSGYISEIEYARLYDELATSMVVQKLTDRDMIKLSLLSSLALINGEDDDPEVAKDLKSDAARFALPAKSGVLNNPIMFTDNTTMLIDGYYDDLTARLKSACSDSWFAAL